MGWIRLFKVAGWALALASAIEPSVTTAMQIAPLAQETGVQLAQARRHGGGSQGRPSARPPAHRPPAYRPPAHRPPVARPPAHRPPAYRPPGFRPPHYHGGWHRPAYAWPPGGAIAAGAALGFLTAAAAASIAAAPQPGLCWYYTDIFQTEGFWDRCP